MKTARFFLALVLVALGCALLISANEPRPVAVWVGDGSHAAIVPFLPSAETSTEVQTS